MIWLLYNLGQQDIGQMSKQFSHHEYWPHYAKNKHKGGLKDRVENIPINSFVSF